jgi:hypothetical protein
MSLCLFQHGFDPGFKFAAEQKKGDQNNRQQCEPKDEELNSDRT